MAATTNTGPGQLPAGIHPCPCMKLLPLVTGVTVHSLPLPPHPTAASYSTPPRARLRTLPPSPSHGVQERGRERERAGDELPAGQQRLSRPAGKVTRHRPWIPATWRGMRRPLAPRRPGWPHATRPPRGFKLAQLRPPLLAAAAAAPVPFPPLSL